MGSLAKRGPGSRGGSRPCTMLHPLQASPPACPLRTRRGCGSAHQGSMAPGNPRCPGSPGGAGLGLACGAGRVQGLIRAGLLQMQQGMAAAGAAEIVCTVRDTASLGPPYP